jgi:phage head maturation protease
MLSGYAVLWNVPSVAGVDGHPVCEVIAPGAFTRTIAQAMRGERNIKCLLNHKRRLGSTRRRNLRLGTDDRGVTFELDGVPLPQPWEGCSFSFYPTKWRQEAALLYRLIEGVLFEISLCTEPVHYPQTKETVHDRNGKR